jgi:hypothetical protein
VAAPPFKLKTTRNPRFRAGIRYEEDVLKHLARNLGEGFLAKPWFCYQGEFRPYPAYCQLDGLFLPRREEEPLILFEAKYRHTADAFFQIENIYRPVVQAVFPGRDIEVVEVVRWYDAAVEFPVPVQLCGDPGKPYRRAFNVHIFNRPVRKERGRRDRDED